MKNVISKILSLKDNQTLNRLLYCTKDAIPTALKTAVWFLKITIPISLLVTLLNYFGILQIISLYLSPIFNLIGLRGEAALVYITSAFLNVYSAIAVITSINFTLREMTILAIMSLIAHNLILETAVQKKTGSKAWHIIVLRIATSVVAAITLNLLLPDQMGLSNISIQPLIKLSFHDMILSWSLSALRLSIKIVVLITLLMILQKILVEFKITDLLSRILSPLLKIMGLPKSTSLTWIVANLLGLAYGSAVMIDEVENGRSSKQEADLLNFHIAISHSNLEDLVLFAAIGISVGWLLFPRLIFAIVAVWGRRFTLKMI